MKIGSYKSQKMRKGKKPPNQKGNCLVQKGNCLDQKGNCLFGLAFYKFAFLTTYLSTSTTKLLAGMICSTNEAYFWTVAYIAMFVNGGRPIKFKNLPWSVQWSVVGWCSCLVRFFRFPISANMQIWWLALRTRIVFQIVAFFRWRAHPAET